MMRIPTIRTNSKEMSRGRLSCAGSMELVSQNSSYYNLKEICQAYFAEVEGVEDVVANNCGGIASTFPFNIFPLIDHKGFVPVVVP